MQFHWCVWELNICLQVGMALVAASLQNFLTVFAALDPLRQGLVTCVGEDAACADALAQPVPAVCGLDRSAWRWTNECGSVGLTFLLRLNFLLRVNVAWRDVQIGGHLV